jgi:hypothetical protein
MRIDHLKGLLQAFDSGGEIIVTGKERIDFLKSIAGFFGIQMSLHHNLPELFPIASLKEMWDTAQISLQKGLE